MGLFSWMSLAGTCSLRGSLPWAWSHGGGELGPALEEVAGSDLFRWSLLGGTYSGRGCSLRPGLTEVAGSDLLLWMSLTEACSHCGHWLWLALAEIAGHNRISQFLKDSILKNPRN